MVHVCDIIKAFITVYEPPCWWRFSALTSTGIHYMYCRHCCCLAHSIWPSEMISYVEGRGTTFVKKHAWHTLMPTLLPATIIVLTGWEKTPTDTESDSTVMRQWDILGT